MYECIAPSRIDLTTFEEMPLTVFLAGTIDMGNSADWQKLFVRRYDNDGLPLVIFNPRREAWDASWEQSINNPLFKEQVDWEMDHLILADIIVFNFEEGSKSPITFAELGMHVADKSKHILVRCPKSFYRKGNVDIICQRANVPVYESMEDLHAVFKYIVYQNNKIKHAKKKGMGQYTLSNGDL